MYIANVPEDIGCQNELVIHLHICRLVAFYIFHIKRSNVKEVSFIAIQFCFVMIQRVPSTISVDLEVVHCYMQLTDILPHRSRQPRWLSGLRRSRVHSLVIARRSLCPEKLGSNPGQGSKEINLSGWHGLDMSITVTKRR